MKKIFIVIAVLVVSAMVAMSAYAIQPDKKSVSQKEVCFKNHLGLSKDQLTKVKELRASFRNDTRDMRYDLDIKRVEMRKLFTDPKTDDATLVAKQKEMSNLRQQLSEKKDAMKLSWRKILTPEQLAKLDKMPHRHHAKRWAQRHHPDVHPTKG